MRKIAIICGGYSGEYEISIKSAKIVKKHLDSTLYDSYLIVIKKGEWYCLADNEQHIPVDKNDFSINIDGERITFDAVFNAVHGIPGENGEILGYFEMLNIPYTSSDFTTCARTFNKDLTKHIAAAHGATVSPSITINKGEIISKDDVIEELGLPLFVKPTCNGSSVGVSKVNTADDFDKAVDTAFAAGNQIMCEKFVKGRELACSVMEFKGKMMVFPLTEVVSKNDFFDYEAKYTEGKSDEITPAELEELEESEVKATSALLYEKFGCKGFARFDYILNEEGLFFIEVNIVPGMSEASIMPKQAAEMGISLGKLFGMAIENLF